MSINGLPEGLELVRLRSPESALAEGEYLLSQVDDGIVAVVRCAPGYTMMQTAAGRYVPVREFAEPKRLAITFDGFTLTFEVSNEVQDATAREMFDHFAGKLQQRAGLTVID